MGRRVSGNARLEGVRLMFKNFQGKGGDFNAEGNRNFGVVLSDEMAEQMLADGWNVKKYFPKNALEEDGYVYWLKVKVRFDNYPPTAVLINSCGKIKLDEETIGQLDWSRIKNADVVISPYNYKGRNGNPDGVTAYLKAIYVTVDEDEFEVKYADIPYLDQGEEY